MERFKSIYNCKLNIQNLIAEIKKKPAIWDPSNEHYSNKILRGKAWEGVIQGFVPEFESLSDSERNEIISTIQKKWKGLRSCYTRELMKMKQEKNGLTSGVRRQYAYFEDLRFLDATCKGSFSISLRDNENLKGELESAVEHQKGALREKGCQKCSGKRKNDDDELIEILKEKIHRSDQQPVAQYEKDEDRLFLLSLTSELRKVPDGAKLEVKADIIKLIAHAQYSNQQGLQDL